MSLEVAQGESWTRSLRGRPGLHLGISAQQRFDGEVEVFVVVVVDETATTTDREIVGDLHQRDVHPLAPDRRYLEGTWHRAPGAVKRPVRAASFRQLYSDPPSELRVQLEALGIDEMIMLPERMSAESQLTADYVTSGTLLVAGVTLLRVSAPRSAVAMVPRPFSLSARGAAPLGVLYLNGPGEWVDAIGVFDGSLGTVTLDISASRAG